MEEAIWFDEFHAEGLITDVLAELRSGKEATVFVCTPGAAADAAGTSALLAVKVYRERSGRSFRNRAAYQEGRIMGKARETRAVANKSRIGRRVEEGLWLDHEFDMLCRLHAAGADVPRPIAATGGAILMEFVGDAEGPAPQLRELRPAPDAARALLARVLWNIERLLAHDVVHADLSPYNILVADGRPWIIDLPQAVDARINSNAEALLARDVERVCRHFARLGVEADPDALARELWGRYLHARL